MSAVDEQLLFLRDAERAVEGVSAVSVLVVIAAEFEIDAGGREMDSLACVDGDTVVECIVERLRVGDGEDEE